MIPELKKILFNQWIELIFQSLILVLLCANLKITYDISRKKNYIKNSPYFSSTPPLEKLCYFAFQSIFEKNSDLSLFNSDLLDQLKDTNFDSFEFTGKEKIYHIRNNQDKKCKVLIEDEIGVRSFMLSWSGSETNESIFGIVISKIKEITIYDLEKEVNGL